MDILEFTKKMHQIEIENDFFNIRDENGLVYWDVVRHDIFYAIYYELADIKPSPPPPINPIKRIKSIVRNVFYNLYTSFKIKPHKYLFFISSRYKNPQNENIDYAICDILDLVRDDDTLIMDNVIRFGQPYHYKSYFNTGRVIASYKTKVFKKIISYKIYKITEVLKCNFKTTSDINKIMLDIMLNYNFEYKYYKDFLNKTTPQKIFVNQNGIQKALFRAANELNIPLYEMQHGLVSFIHPAYHYPKEIDYKHLNTFPKYFLTFSKFWSKNINYPVDKIITVGNNFFAQKLMASEKIYDLTFISADIYSNDINAVIHQLLKEGFAGRIALKLHPNQYAEIEGIRDNLSSFSNVTVIYNEVTIKEILQSSHCIFAIQSTCVYEALDNNIKVLIYKIKDYQTHADVFDNANLYLIDSLDGIDKCLKISSGFNNNDGFFENFRETVLLNALKRINL